MKSQLKQNPSVRTAMWIQALAVVAAMTVPAQSPAAVLYVSNAPPLRFQAIGAGTWHSLGVLSNGTVVAWGENNFGESTAPNGLSGVVAVAGGDGHSLALKSDGTVVAWGENYYDESTVPSGLNNVVGIAAGELHSLAVKSDGTVVAWGIGQPGAPVDANDHGQALVPSGLSGVVAVAAGYAHNLALKSDGTIVAWQNGQTVAVPGGLSNVVAITAGRSHSLALKADGTVVAWGNDALGQTDVPAGLSGVVAISARIYNNLALKSDGTVVTWGWPSVQNPVPSVSNVVAVAAGGQHDLALRPDGSLLAWGDDGFGQTDVPGTFTPGQNIQDTVDAAQDGDTVLVKPGQYHLTNQVTVTKAITLQSTAGAGQTFLNAKANIWCLWVSNSLAIVDGFTLRNPNSGGFNAGGIESFGTTIQNCIFTNFSLAGPAPFPTPGTSATMHGGVLSNSVVFYSRIPSGLDANAVYCVGGGRVTDCQILGIAGGSGTAVHLENSQLLNSVVTGTGQGGSGRGAGPAVNAVNSTIASCIISNNLSISLAGGAYLNNCLMDRCIVADNTYGSPSRCWGGGIFEVNSIIRDSLIVGNTLRSGLPEPQTFFGGGLYMQGGGMVNCTVAGNRARSCPPNSPGSGAGVYVESGGITNSIIFGNFLYGCVNSEDDWFNAGGGAFDHCCTAPDPGGFGNLALDPQFVDPANGDFRVLPSSLCVAAGAAQDWMASAFDLDANPRTTYGFVDMGAYQRQFATPQNRAEGIIGAVTFLVGQGVLSQNHRSGLTATVRQSEKSMNAGRVSTACNQLRAFVHQVSSLFREGALSAAQAQALTNQANSLRAAVGCQ